MYFLNNFCCICMNKRDLKHLFDMDNDGISHYNKLTSSIAEMNFKQMNNQRLICGECCVTLNTVYNFRQTCLRSKANLITYLSQLKRFSHVSGTLSVRTNDVLKSMRVVKEEIEIKCDSEGSNCIEENNPDNLSKTESYEEIMCMLATVKQECESEEEASSAHEEATAGQMIETDVKIEDVENETMVEDEYYIEFDKIDIEEDPLAEVKQEFKLDIRAPQDGSTRQGVEPPRVPMESDESKIGLLYCEACKKNFTNETNFKSHMQEHTSENLYKCDICMKGFNQRGYYIYHKRFHFGQTTTYECNICGKSFKHKSNFRSHMRIHSGEKPYKCEKCDKCFMLKYQLTKHMGIHFDGRPYECEICKKRFFLQVDYTRHLEFHSGDRPFNCEVCKMRFFQMCKLKVHMRIHTGERPYQCEVCKKGFVQKNNYTRHMQIHSGDNHDLKNRI